MTINEKYLSWCKNVSDKGLLSELKGMEGDEKAITNAFYKNLEFGTGGLRGEISVGSNCLNIYTIGKVTQGIADNMLVKGGKSVAISFDSRINSDVFAKRTAQVFASCGIKTYLTKELMPTPFLSYIVRELHCDMGVMITASHNPAKYNGYKVYDADGCQLTDDAANEMIDYIEKVDEFSVNPAPFNELVETKMIEFAADSLTEGYLEAVQAKQINSAKGLKVTYTPLNGTGYKLVPEILKRAGVTEIIKVDEQKYPDGRFSTCSFPNPEKPEALKLGLIKAKESQSDILIATDPDADRMGIAVRVNGDYQLMTGNEVGVLLTDYVLGQKKQNGTLPKNPVVVKSIVSSSLGDKVAEMHGATMINVLTGFKYIGDQIKRLEVKGEVNRFVFGFEESYGYLAGSYVRDKDAVIASMLTAEMTAYYKAQGKTLVDRINELYAQFGYYEHKLLSFEFAGAAGNAKMKELMAKVRKNPSKEFAGLKVTKLTDYMTQTEIDLPKANVLVFDLEKNAKIIMRPSGTEPLIKIYLTSSVTKEENKIIFDKFSAELNEIFK